MRRREFINLIGSATVWPLAANAQQRERLRRIGVWPRTISKARPATVVRCFFAAVHESTFDAVDGFFACCWR